MDLERTYRRAYTYSINNLSHDLYAKHMAKGTNYPLHIDISICYRHFVSGAKVYSSCSLIHNIWDIDGNLCLSRVLHSRVVDVVKHP